MTVLMICQEADAPVDGVITELTNRGVPVFRCDTSWFPQRLTLTAELVGSRWHGSLSTEYRAVDLREIRSVWYRDPTAFRFPPELTAVERAYAHREARLGFGGIVACLDNVPFMNMPNRAADAMFKPLQLAVAAASGLAVPSTMITNEPDAVRRFATANIGGVVQKSLGPNSISEGGDLKVAYTRPITNDQLRHLDGVRTTCTQIQARTIKRADARLIVVGETLFLFEITAETPAGMADYRADPEHCTYQWVPTPPDLTEKVHRYMKTLGLTYAALDFGIDKDTGRLDFYESNSNGQWLWLEHQTGAPITSAIADLLAAGGPP